MKLKIAIVMSSLPAVKNPPQMGKNVSTNFTRGGGGKNLGDACIWNPCGEPRWGDKILKTYFLSPKNMV